ncbi:MAG: hypothetical protein H6Q36_1161 [Chloroflexi bacterium]|nr:hypothetical protein [Chloroflexota bacterium]
MGAIHSLARRTLFARRARTILTILGIGLGIGVLVAAVVTNASLDAAAASTVRERLGNADVRISALEERGLSPASVAAAAAAPGVAIAAPQLEARTYPRLSATGGGAALPDPVTVIGVDPVVDPKVHARPLSAGSGLPADRADVALVSEALARDDGLVVGETITLEGAADAKPAVLTVTGIVAATGGPDPAGRNVVVPLATAQALFQPGDAGGRVSRVDVVAADGADPSAVEEALVAALALEPYSLTTPAEAEADLVASTSGLRGIIALVVVVVLFGAAFLVFNTLAMSVAERVREVGLLRAAGMTRRQVRLLVLFQAVHLGVGGAIVGLVLGIGLATGVTVLLGGAVPAAAGSPVLPPLEIALALLVGLAVTAAAALEPAFLAASIPPVEALRLQADLAGGRPVRLRWLLAVLVLVGAVGLLLIPVPATAAGYLAPLAVYGILVVAALAIPFVLGPLGRLAGLLVAPFLPLEERLTRGALVRDRSRAALTVGALVVAVAMISALGGVAASTRAAADAWLTEVVPGNEVLVAVHPVALDDPVLDELRAVDGVARVSPIGRFAIAAGGYRLDTVAISGADFAADGRLRFVAGDPATALAALDAGGAAILSRGRADALGLDLGGTLTATAAEGPVDLAVAGIVDRSVPGESGEAVLVGWPDASRLGALGADLFAVRYAAGAEATARPALDDVAVLYALQPADLGDIRGAVGTSLERMFDLLDMLAVVALLVAALGIANTLTMNVLERVREIGVLRAAGLTRRQVWRMVVVEATILALVGAAVGAVAGVAAAGTMVAAGGGTAPSFDPGWLTLGMAVAGSVALATLAAVYPARVAGRIEIVRAVSYE